MRVGVYDVALAMESTDGSEDRACAVKAAERLSERRDVKCAVAVCYANKVPYEFTEETRYACRVIHKPGQDSEWMTGAIADLALTVALAPAVPREPGDAARALAENLVVNDSYFGRSGSCVTVVCNCRSCSCRPCASLVR